MAFLEYKYDMKISYSEPVEKCYFTIKSVPADDFRQRNISFENSLIPPTTYSESMDSFGNIQIIGSENRPHSEFIYSVKGMVETFPGNVTGGIELNRIGMYKYPRGKCIPGDSINAFADEIKSQINIGITDKEKCNLIMQLLYEKFAYETGSTVIDTTAEEAFEKGKGVCQDYSHIFICLLRLFGIPARYVCGLIVGEGKSHAWVEAACEGNFLAFDPTHNRKVTDEYIKLSVGRDASDCAINRGVMWGGGIQTQDINVLVKKLY